MFLRRYTQQVHLPKDHVVEPPADFAERAYAAGFDAGSGMVRTEQQGDFVEAHLYGKIKGVVVHLVGAGTDEEKALGALLTRLEALHRGEEARGHWDG